MNTSDKDKLKEKSIANSAAFGIGAALGAHAKHAINPAVHGRFTGAEKLGSQKVSPNFSEFRLSPPKLKKKTNLTFGQT